MGYAPCTSQEARSRACPVLKAKMSDVLASFEDKGGRCLNADRCNIDFWQSKCQELCDSEDSTERVDEVNEDQHRKRRAETWRASDSSTNAYENEEDKGAYEKAFSRDTTQ